MQIFTTTLNQMLVMFIFMALGFFNIPLPIFVKTAVTTAGNCMSPLAMLLTGFVIGEYSIKKACRS